MSKPMPFAQSIRFTTWALCALGVVLSGVALAIWGRGAWVPLVVFGGPGSASRATIGIVVIFGVAFSTLLSLFVVPAFYSLLAKYTRSPEELAQRLDTLEASTPEAGGHA